MSGRDLQLLHPPRAATCTSLAGTGSGLAKGVASAKTAKARVEKTEKKRILVSGERYNEPFQKKVKGPYTRPVLRRAQIRYFPPEDPKLLLIEIVVNKKFLRSNTAFRVFKDFSNLMGRKIIFVRGAK